MKKAILFVCGLLIFQLIYAQIPPGYYNAASGLSGEELQEALHEIINSHNSPTYSQLWNYLESTDKKSNGKVWDIYSDVPGGTPPYVYTFYTDQCGNYNSEGDCYNREHSFPKSWFGGNVYPMYADLYQVYPTDGYVNGKRANYPYGEVGSASWTSMNGSKLGSNTTPGYSGTVFEPIDEYKGDLARTFFYMATRYLGEDSNWPGSPMVNGSQPLDWALNLLYNWHQQDPVSQKEIDRNNAIYLIQDNRNPFIDHPEFVGDIWFSTGINEQWFSSYSVSVYPNPVQDMLNISIGTFVQDEPLEIIISDQSGRVINRIVTKGRQELKINTSELEKGFYLLSVIEQETGKRTCKKFIK